MFDDGKSKSEIQEFFYGTNVFVTGATGFIGQVLIEKILRACSVNKMYILVRPKKAKDPQARLREMFNAALFEKLRDEKPDFMDQLSTIVGDCAEPNLGLSADDQELIISNVNIVIHCAATINFNGPLKRACFINVRSTKDLLLIARRMQRLKSFVHVSTAFANPNQPFVEEIIYKCHLPGDTLIDMAENMSDPLMESITTQCLGSWPNTYSFSKCIAENIVKQYCKDLPLCITRPCVVICTEKEPVPGWLTSLRSVPGLCLGIGIGAIRVINWPKDRFAIVAPADYVANMIIASAWHASKPRSEPSIPVFNYVPNNMAPPITLGEALGGIVEIINKNKLHSEKEIWQPSITLTSSNLFYTILFFIYHFIPAFLADIYLWITGNKMKMVKLYKQLDIMMRGMKYFADVSNFDNSNVLALLSSQNVTDKQLFNIDLSNINWQKTLLECILGTRKYILKDSSNTTNGQKRHQKVLMIHYTLNTILYGSLLYLIYVLMK